MLCYSAGVFSIFLSALWWSSVASVIDTACLLLFFSPIQVELFQAHLVQLKSKLVLTFLVKSSVQTIKEIKEREIISLCVDTVSSDTQYTNSLVIHPVWELDSVLCTAYGRQQLSSVKLVQPHPPPQTQKWSVYNQGKTIKAKNWYREITCRTAGCDCNGILRSLHLNWNLTSSPLTVDLLRVSIIQ